MINLLYVFLFLVLIGAILCNMRICHYFNQQMQTLRWSVNKQKYCNILSIALGTISVILLLPFLFGYSDIWFVCSALGFVALLSVLSYCDYQIFMHNKKHNVWWNKLTYFANFVSNTYDNVNNAYNSVKQDYFGQRNYQNRYKQGCTPSNIAYNTISNYQISPNQKLVENGNIVSNYIMKKVLSAIPGVGTYVNGIVAGDKVANGLTNIYNAMDEADCFK